MQCDPITEWHTEYWNGASYQLACQPTWSASSHYTTTAYFVRDEAKFLSTKCLKCNCKPVLFPFVPQLLSVFCFSWPEESGSWTVEKTSHKQSDRFCSSFSSVLYFPPTPPKTPVASTLPTFQSMAPSQTVILLYCDQLHPNDLQMRYYGLFALKRFKPGLQHCKVHVASTAWERSDSQQCFACKLIKSEPILLTQVDPGPYMDMWGRNVPGSVYRPDCV